VNLATERCARLLGVSGFLGTAKSAMGAPQASISEMPIGVCSFEVSKTFILLELIDGKEMILAAFGCGLLYCFC